MRAAGSARHAATCSASSGVIRRNVIAGVIVVHVLGVIAASAYQESATVARR
jgi:hypothetical protein